MLTASLADFRKDIQTYFDRVSKNLDTLLVKSEKEKGVVMMSLDEYNALLATVHESSSKANEARLDSAIAKFSTGQSFDRELIEP